MNLHILGNVNCLAALQFDTTESYFGRQIGCREGLRTGDDEIKFVGGTGGKSDLVEIFVNDPFGGLSNHRASLIKQEARGAGEFNILAEIVFHRQLHNRLLADDFRWRDCDSNLRLHRGRAN